MRAMRRVLGLGLLVALLAAGCGGEEGDEGPTGAEIVSRASTAFADTKSFHLVYDLSGQTSGGSGLALRHAEGDVEVSEGVQNGIELDVAGSFSGIPFESQLVIVEGEGLLKD